MESERSARLVFAENIRKHRQARDIAQEKMALLAGLDRAYYGRVERGRMNITIDNMEKIARALGVPLGELLR